MAGVIGKNPLTAEDGVVLDYDNTVGNLLGDDYYFVISDDMAELIDFEYVSTEDPYPTVGQLYPIGTN